VSTCLDSDDNQFEADAYLIHRFIGMGRRKGGVKFVRYREEEKYLLISEKDQAVREVHDISEKKRGT
jgi:hypothetical protein